MEHRGFLNMELQLSLLFFVEAVGTIAFASSGAMVAIKKQLDLLGVIVLGVTTAVGGGMLGTSSSEMCRQISLRIRSMYYLPS